MKSKIKSESCIFKQKFVNYFTNFTEKPLNNLRDECVKMSLSHTVCRRTLKATIVGQCPKNLNFSHTSLQAEHFHDFTDL